MALMINRVEAEFDLQPPSPAGAADVGTGAAPDALPTGDRALKERLRPIVMAILDEELDRLDSHVKEIRRVFTQKEPQGRRLDFLLQEFNREANTLGSKSVDIRTTNIAVELKVLIDQIREQAQNIE